MSVIAITAHYNLPFVALWEIEGTEVTRLPDLLGRDNIQADATLTHNGKYLYVNDPIVKVYEREANGFSLLSYTPGFPIRGGSKFSPSGKFLAGLLHYTESPWAKIYNVNEYTLTEAPALSVAPLRPPTGIAFTNDDSRLVLGFQSAEPFLSIYAGTGDAFTTVDNYSPAVTDWVLSISINQDNTMIALGLYYGSPSLVVYELNGGLYEKRPNLPEAPTKSITGVAFSPDGRYLVACWEYALPNLAIYEFDGASFIKLSGPPDLPVTNFLRVSWSISGEYLAIETTDHYIILYHVDGGVFTKLLVPAELRGSIQFSESPEVALFWTNFKDQREI